MLHNGLLNVAIDAVINHSIDDASEIGDDRKRVVDLTRVGLGEHAHEVEGTILTRQKNMKLLVGTTIHMVGPRKFKERFEIVVEERLPAIQGVN
jgi:hypothetical protein